MNKLWIKKGKIGLWIIGLILTGCGEKVPNLSESHEKWYTHANSISVLSKGIFWTPTLDHQEILRVNITKPGTETLNFTSEQGWEGMTIHRITEVNDRTLAVWMLPASESKEDSVANNGSSFPAVVAIWNRKIEKIERVMSVPLEAAVQGINAYVIDDNHIRRFILSQGEIINGAYITKFQNPGDVLKIAAVSGPRLIFQVSAEDDQKNPEQHVLNYLIWDDQSRVPWSQIKVTLNFPIVSGSIFMIGNYENKLFFQAETALGIVVFQADSNGIDSLSELGTNVKSNVCVSESGYYFFDSSQEKVGTTTNGISLILKQATQNELICTFENGITADISPVGGYLLAQIVMPEGQTEQWLIHPQTGEKRFLQRIWVN